MTALDTAAAVAAIRQVRAEFELAATERYAETGFFSEPGKVGYRDGYLAGLEDAENAIREAK